MYYSRHNPIVAFFKGIGVGGVILGVIALIVGAVCLPTVAVFYFWNAFIVVQFGLKPIGWFVAFCITVVLGLIFKGTTITKKE